MIPKLIAKPRQEQDKEGIWKKSSFIWFFSKILTVQFLYCSIVLSWMRIYRPCCELDNIYLDKPYIIYSYIYLWDEDASSDRKNERNAWKLTPAKARTKKVTKVEKPTPAVADNNRNRKKKKKTFSGTYFQSILISRAYQKMMKLIEI